MIKLKTMKNKEEILNIISNKDIDALQDWINKGGDAKAIIDKSLRKKSLIQCVIDEIDDDDDEFVYLKMLEILIKNGADVNYFNETFNSPVSDLIGLNKLKLLKLILENGANINFADSESTTPLIRATLDEDIELMNLLLPYADKDLINKSGSYHAKTPLGLALHFANLEFIEMLLKYNANPSAIDGEGYLTIENIPKDIDEEKRKEIMNLVNKYKIK
jgi:ankyrin repeat protein